MLCRSLERVLHDNLGSATPAASCLHDRYCFGDRGGGASHHLDYREVRIRNVPTNVREFGGTRYNGNSIFVFEVADLCIAHLGHLHHTLTPTHLTELGTIDVVLVPVDGTYTLNQEEMIEVLRQIGPKIVVPMHIFSQASLEKFLTRAGRSEERRVGKEWRARGWTYD